MSTHDTENGEGYVDFRANGYNQTYQLAVARHDVWAEPKRHF